MPKGKLSDNDRARLSNHFWAIVLRVSHEHDCWPGEVLNRLRKSHGVKGISPARAEIVREMRESAYTWYRKGECLLGLRKHDLVAPANAKPISLTVLARMIGCDHSALVLAQQKLSKQNETFATPQKTTDKG